MVSPSGTRYLRDTFLHSRDGILGLQNRSELRMLFQNFVQLRHHEERLNTLRYWKATDIVLEPRCQSLTQIAPANVVEIGDLCLLVSHGFVQPQPVVVVFGVRLKKTLQSSRLPVLIVKPQETAKGDPVNREHKLVTIPSRECIRHGAKNSAAWSN